MSTLLESISQISGGYSDLTLQEMPIDYKSPSLHREIASILKHMVAQSICGLKITQEPMVEPISDKAGRRKAEIKKGSTVGKLSISFKLPADCIINKIDMDKVVLSHQNFKQLRKEGKTNLTRQFSFKERMESWNVERRQRQNGTYDVFYSHSKSRRMFRYIPEVVNFLQYEVYYDNQIKNRVPLEQNPVKYISKEVSTLKRKRKSTSSECAKRHQALTNEDGSNFEGKQNVTTKNMLKTIKSNNSFKKSKREMEQSIHGNGIEHSGKTIASKGHDCIIPKEEHGTKVGSGKIVDAILIKEMEYNIIKGDGSLEVMPNIYESANIDQKGVKYEFQDLRDEISLDWTESDGLIDAYYEECELIDHIPTCGSVCELVEFLVTQRSETQG